ncbi:MAG: hypothetical protein VXU50_01825, partial [Verrucomicrobiota bacterium]|nr:hypothetical protein [Verrucomicrobiota bacterium]
MRGPTIIYFLKTIVDDLAKRPHTAAHLEILKMFMGNLLTFITEKPEELQVSITLIRDSVGRLSTEEEQQARPPRRSRSLRPDSEEEERVDGMDRHLAQLTKAYEESPITELTERAQHMQNGFTVFMNVARSIESTPTMLDEIFNLFEHNTAEFLGNFGDRFVIGTNLSVMNSAARKSLQEINSKQFPDARKDAFVKSMLENGIGQTTTTNAVKALESIIFSVGGSPLEEGGIVYYGDQIGFAAEFNIFTLAPHIITQLLGGSVSQAFRSRRSTMNSSMSGSGGEASRKTQLLTSLAILSTYSERGPGGKLALAPTQEMHILVKLMAAASLKMLQLFSDVIEECRDSKSKYYKMVIKSVHVDHSDLSIWIDSINKIRFHEFDT